MKMLGDRMPMMGPPCISYHGTKYGELFERGKPFGNFGEFEKFANRVTKLARDRHHPDDMKDVIVLIHPGDVYLSLGENIRKPYAERMAEEEERRRQAVEQYEKHKYDRQDYGDESDDY